MDVLNEAIHREEAANHRVVYAAIHVDQVGDLDLLMACEAASQQSGGNGGKILPRLRVAALSAYYDSIQNQLHRDERVTLQMDHIDWLITAIHKESHAWAGRSSYQTLIQRQLIPPTRLTFHFVTPTTFRSQTVNMPLPLPALVFGSLLSRWSLFTPHRLRDLPQDQLDMFIAHHVVIAHHKLQTALVRGK
jgi:CRISPR/Cas system endoribonuclease Cas6 (RAMP superfamily)